MLRRPPPYTFPAMPRPALCFRNVLAVAFLLIAPLPALGQGSFVVTTTADGNHGACTISLCTLRDAIIAANAFSQATIHLPANPNPYVLTIPGTDEDFGATGDLDIRTKLTIQGIGGSNPIVDGGGLDRVFHIVGDFDVIITSVTIRNGGGVDQGGGILALAGELTLNNCVVRDNKVTGSGGGIYKKAGTPLVSLGIFGSTIYFNEAGDE